MPQERRRALMGMWIEISRARVARTGSSVVPSWARGLKWQKKLRKNF